MQIFSSQQNQHLEYIILYYSWNFIDSKYTKTRFFCITCGIRTNLKKLNLKSQKAFFDASPNISNDSKSFQIIKLKFLKFSNNQKNKKVARSTKFL